MPAYRRLKRQGNVTGLSDDSVTLSNTAGTAQTATAIAFDTDGGDDSASYTGPVPGLAGTQSVVVTDAETTPTASPSSTSASATATPESSSNASSGDLPLGTVIGACVGAFAGAALIVLFGIWLYNRATPRRRGGDRSISALSNRRGDRARSQSGAEFWNKLGDGRDRESGSDHWTDPETKQVEGGVTRMENMFKKSPSIRTAYTHTTEKSFEEPLPSSFGVYHPNLARELAGAGPDEPEPPRPFLHRIETTPAFAWHDSATGSLASLKSSNAEGRMSPSLSVAIPTPPAQASPLHQWETAEVLNFDPSSDADPRNPFSPPTSHAALPDEPTTPLSNRRSIGNPFFKSQEGTYRRRSSSTLTPKKDKGKGRSIPSVVEPPADAEDPFQDANPFSDPVTRHASAMTATTAATHDSVVTNDRALQNLIAVLDTGAHNSLSPPRHDSYMTVSSAYSDASEVMGTPPHSPSPNAR
ncbi:uncharacterized protein SCHCODRAFT_02283791 [Schizophyllum commune H4-8]|uniref:Expressed protein n=1 Tax=Schizophyllum commune (strain H4-8 / FGSC 9210) TaxID=578458 RepID=D8Q5M7_SCHCM|nr:uncharacterized protein SCHCODRAFT_02283791 [Schizophyllum commune H4-8]KAI5892114.1 hypothetical protein SCHCODRAFT_02283791 [Schizophyllum commune H4-8]